MDVRGMIAVGTDGGWVLVYGFGQELRFTLGTEQIGRLKIAFSDAVRRLTWLKQVTLVP
jgi:hypothetical protein